MKVFRTNILYFAIFCSFIAFSLQKSFATSESPILISDINTISLDEIGILNSKNGGLPSDIWMNSRHSFILSLLTNIPNHISSATIKDLRHKILLTSATPPTSNNKNKESLLIIRLKILASLGYSDDVKKIIKLIPTTKMDEEIHTINVASYFIAEQYKEACQEVDNFLATYQSLFWRESHIICNAYNKNNDKLNFNILLLSEDGHKVSTTMKTAIDFFKKGDKLKGYIEWSNILKNIILKNQPIISNLPEPPNLNNAVINKDIIKNWHDKNKDIKDSLLLEKLTQLYAKIEAAGGDVPLAYWQDLILYSISHNIKLPQLALYKSIEDGTNGEIILLTILCLGDSKKSSISDVVLVKIIKALNHMGLSEEAKKIAEETI